jgi:hypothetical protein
VSPVASNIGTLALVKQTAKGTYGATPTVKFNLAAAPSVYPVREIARYTMTGAGRDQGPAYTNAVYVTGEFQVYMHFDGMALLSYLALGSNADSGTTPNFIHTATPGLSLPYFTIFRMVGNQIFERFVDCKCSRIAIESAAGSPVLVTFGIEGITAEFQAADTALAALSSSGLLHMEAKGAFKHATVAQPLANWTFELNNGVQRYQADDYLPYDVTEGVIDASGSFRVLFSGPTAFPKYRDFFYGSSSGTQLQVSSTAGVEAFQALWQRNTNASFQIDVPQIRYESVPVTPDPSGDPLEVEVAYMVEKIAGQSQVTLTTKDQTATV